MDCYKFKNNTTTLYMTKFSIQHHVNPVTVITRGSKHTEIISIIIARLLKMLFRNNLQTLTIL